MLIFRTYSINYKQVLLKAVSAVSNFSEEKKREYINTKHSASNKGQFSDL